MKHARNSKSNEKPVPQDRPPHVAAPIAAPIVHLNGTSRETLLQQWSDIYDALERVVELLKQAAPNGRDYYPDPGSYERAVGQHERRMLAVRDLQAEIETEMDRIA